MPSTSVHAIAGGGEKIAKFTKLLNLKGSCTTFERIWYSGADPQYKLMCQISAGSVYLHVVSTVHLLFMLAEKESHN